MWITEYMLYAERDENINNIYFYFQTKISAIQLNSHHFKLTYMQWFFKKFGAIHVQIITAFVIIPKI